MSRKAYVPEKIAPLQRVVAEPITDPAEQAALDRLRQRGKRKQSGQKVRVNRRGARAASKPTTRGSG